MKRAILLASLTPFALYAMPAAAKPSVVVGACKPNLPSYGSIGAALMSSPAGAVINVCPGVYAEQLTITKGVTLQGVSDGMSSAPTIVPPAGGLATNYTSGSGTQYAAQVLALNANNVTIANLTINGTGNNLNCAPILTGVMFVNSAGAIRNNQAINQALSPQSQLGGCQTGNAIEARSEDGRSHAVTITGNQVTGFQKNGIIARGIGLLYSITGNSVVGQGATPSIAQNGIELISGSAGVTSLNVVSDLYYTGADYGSIGVLVYNAPNASVTSNTVSNTQGAVFVEEDGTTADTPAISKNIVTTTHTFDGIDVCGVSGGTISANTINGSDGAAIHVDGECGAGSNGVTVSTNKVNGACAGVLEGSLTSGTSIQNNVVRNATVIMQGNSDTCTVTTPQSLARLRGGLQHTHHLVVRP